MPELSQVFVGDDASVWARLGFDLDGDRCWVAGIEFVLTGDGRGIGGWMVAEADGASPVHPNGVFALDHLVVLTPDLDDAIRYYEGSGLELRRVREAGGGRRQAFFRLGRPILEVVGPADVTEPRAAWGLSFSTRDLDATAALLGGLLRPPKDAVQPGRRIATVDRSAGSSTAIAFMSPHRRATPPAHP